MITIQPYVHYPCNLIAQANSRHQDYFLTFLAPVESWLTLRGPTAGHSRSWRQCAHVGIEIDWTPKGLESSSTLNVHSTTQNAFGKQTRNIIGI